MIVAQPIPANANKIYIKIGELLAVINIAMKKDVASNATPTKIVFLLPNLDAIKPTGKYAAIAPP